MKLSPLQQQYLDMLRKLDLVKEGGDEEDVELEISTMNAIELRQCIATLRPEFDELGRVRK